MKSLFEQIGGTYREENGYLIPNLTLPDEEQIEIGIWGMRHLEYIKHYRKGFYTSLVLDCKLNRYLAEVNKQAKKCLMHLSYNTKLLKTSPKNLKRLIKWSGLG